jgi:hypothetical protein
MWRGVLQQMVGKADLWGHSCVVVIRYVAVMSGTCDDLPRYVNVFARETFLRTVN